MDIIGIYILANVPTGKCIVGSSKKCKHRINEHLLLLRAKKHYNRYLQHAWNKYGENDFRSAIIEECSLEERFIREQWWVDYLKTSNSDHGYNLTHPVKTLVPSPYVSKRAKEQYQIPEVRATRFKGLEEGRIIANEQWYDQNSNVRKTRERNLSLGYAVLAKLLKDPVWCASRKTGSRTKELWQRPDYREQALQRLPKIQAKGAAGFKKRWDTDPEFRKERETALEKNRSDAGFKERHKKKMAGFWSDPEYRARHSAWMKARWAKYRKEHNQE